MVGGRSVGQHVAVSYPLALRHHGLLVNARVLIRSLELGQVVDVHPGVCSIAGLLINPDDDAGGVNVEDPPWISSQYQCAGVPGGDELHASAHQGRLGLEQRHGLALHVASHKGTVGVVVFQKGDQACCDAHELHR